MTGVQTCALPILELYRRQPDGTWSLIEANGLESAITLTSIGYTLSLRELYENVLGNVENAVSSAS